MKYVRDAAGYRVDQGPRRFSFDTTVSETGRVTKRRPFASDIDQNALTRRSIGFMYVFLSRLVYISSN